MGGYLASLCGNGNKLTISDAVIVQRTGGSYSVSNRQDKISLGGCNGSTVIQRTLFILTLNTTTKFVIMTI